MQINTNINLADREDLKKAEDSFGQFVRIFFLLGIIIFPWFLIPNLAKPLELPREVFLFSFVSLAAIFYFIQLLKRKEFEWRRTKLNWVLAVWSLGLGLIFLYSSDFKVAWEGYPGSLTGGLSEYLAFIVFYLLSVQLFTVMQWKKMFQYFLISVASVLVFFIVITVYFHNNNILTINFARTPSLIAAAVGAAALALWWVSKKTEPVSKGYSFVVVLLLFFISSLLDFYVSWWMWLSGVAFILFFDLVSKRESYVREKEERQIGLGKESGGLLSLFFHGDAKYLFLVFLFSLSRSLSPIFLNKQKLDFMPFFSYLVQYPIIGRKVFFYLLLNLVIFCFGCYYFWKLKKERVSIILVLSGLAGISVGHLLYYSESTILFFLNWILIVYGGLTFLRKAPEKDYLFPLKTGSKGKKVFIILGTISLVVMLGLTVLKINSLFK